MAGFVSNPPGSIASPPAPDNVVAGDGFYPALTLADVREAMRIPEQVTPLRLREAVIGAVITVTRDLFAWKLAQLAAGRTALEQAATAEIAGEPDTVLLYRRAVYAYAAADLVDTHHDIAASRDGQERAEQRALSADEHRRNGIHAVRDILGLGRIAVELI